MQSPSPVAVILLAAAAYGCHQLSKKFKYIHTPQVQRKQLAKIPGMTAHLHNRAPSSSAPSATEDAKHNPLAR